MGNSLKGTEFIPTPHTNGTTFAGAILVRSWWR